MIFGYARVSTKDQNLDLQVDALKKAGCETIFQEKASGLKTYRPELEKLLSKIHSNDTLVVYSLDRLGLTVKQLIDLITDFKTRQIHFKSISEVVFNTTSPMGEAILQIIAILKAMEVNINRERTLSGLSAARSRGKNGGRPMGSYNKITAAAAVSLYQKQVPVSDILSTLKISRATLYNYLKYENIKYN
jgi:DNA invertase Pin-like site-specific DNA recombinase